MTKIERKITSKNLELQFSGPKSPSTRDMAKILTTINNLHNYFVFLSVPEVQNTVVPKLKESKTKKPKTLLYSSSLEWVIGKKNRMKIMSISMSSPVRISLIGPVAAIDGLKLLFEMYKPIFSAIDLLDKKRMMLKISSLELKPKDDEPPISKDLEKIFNQFKDFTDNINSLDIDNDLKDYVLASLKRNIRSINANPISPMLME